MAAGGKGRHDGGLCYGLFGGDLVLGG